MDSIKISHIRETKTEYATKWETAVFTRVPENLYIDSIDTKYSIQRFGDKVVFHGYYELEGKKECDVCLDLVNIKLEKDFQVELFPKSYLNISKSKQMDAELGDIDFYENEEIQIIKLFEDQILLDTEEVFRCKEDCKGLCFRCGANLNLQACNCNTSQTLEFGKLVN